MDLVIVGIEAGDKACIALGVDFVEEDRLFPFGMVLKANTARALRRAELDGYEAPYFDQCPTCADHEASVLAPDHCI